MGDFSPASRWRVPEARLSLHRVVLFLEFGGAYINDRFDRDKGGPG